MTVDRDTLLKLKVQAKSIDVPGVGEFRYRGMTRNEATSLGEANSDGDIAVSLAEAKLFAMCVVEPKMTEVEWTEIGDTLPAGLLEPLSRAIAEASAINEDAAKAAYQRFR